MGGRLRGVTLADLHDERSVGRLECDLAVQPRDPIATAWKPEQLHGSLAGGGEGQGVAAGPDGYRIVVPEQVTAGNFLRYRSYIPAL
jgi:hypothetical protein